MKGMTREEILSLLHRLKVQTDFPEVRQFCARQILLYTDSCPICGANIYEFSRILRIREYANYDFVTYICQLCKTGFRKIEFKDPDEPLIN